MYKIRQVNNCRLQWKEKKKPKITPPLGLAIKIKKTV